MIIWDNIKVLEKRGLHRVVDHWLRLANQMELFDPQEYELTPEQRREQGLRLLPEGFKDYRFGPLYHGSPVSNKIMETGLGTKKTPMFGGFNTPYFPENIYFGMNPAIAKEYAGGGVQGMQYGYVISEINGYLDMIGWSKEQIIDASEEDYEKFEIALEKNMQNSEPNDYELYPEQVAQIIWEYLRNEHHPGVVKFNSSFEDIMPDEDYVYQLVQYGSEMMSSDYNHNMINREFIETYKDNIIEYMVEDISNYIYDDKFMDDKQKVKVQNIAALEDKALAFDKLLEFLRKQFKNLDDYDIASNLELFSDEDIGREELINLSLARDLVGMLRHDVLRGLGVISAFAVGKASIPPIPKEDFDRNKVRLYDER